MKLSRKAAAHNTNNGVQSEVVSSLLNAITGSNTAGTLVKNNATPITNNLSSLPGFGSVVQPAGSTPPPGTPQAYLTVIFFDERFNFIAAADGGVAQR